MPRIYFRVIGVIVFLLSAVATVHSIWSCNGESPITEKPVIIHKCGDVRKHHTDWKINPSSKTDKFWLEERSYGVKNNDNPYATAEVVSLRKHLFEVTGWNVTGYLGRESKERKEIILPPLTAAFVFHFEADCDGFHVWSDPMVYKFPTVDCNPVDKYVLLNSKNGKNGLDENESSRTQTSILYFFNLGFHFKFEQFYNVDEYELGQALNGLFITEFINLLILKKLKSMRKSPGTCFDWAAAGGESWPSNPAFIPLIHEGYGIRYRAGKPSLYDRDVSQLKPGSAKRFAQIVVECGPYTWYTDLIEAREYVKGKCTDSWWEKYGRFHRCDKCDNLSCVDNAAFAAKHPEFALN